eukprot:TRINITY_DN10142_c0_g1_i1.p1 TRINITY_DN10142_c0_g1~~TRINITY_DN10142_c0_g1_i1.p1  ORF type:complete len:548 (-),score=155.81 TRINITY_DN10142_c0_g1_i1:358-1932(-)
MLTRSVIRVCCQRSAGVAPASGLRVASRLVGAVLPTPTVSPRPVCAGGLPVRRLASDAAPVRPAADAHDDALGPARQAIAERRWKDAHALLQGLVSGSTPEETRCRALDTLGFVHFAEGATDKAIESMAASLELSRRLGLERMQLKTLHGLGSVYSRQRDVTQANRHLKEAVALALKLNETKLAGALYTSLGTSFSADGLHEAAVKYYGDAVAIARQLLDHKDELKALALLAKEYSRLGAVEQSTSTWQLALRAARNLANPDAEWQAVLEMGQNHSRAGHHDAAADLFRQALALARRAGDKKRQLLALQALARAHELNDDAQEAAKAEAELGKLSGEFGGTEGAAQGGLSPQSLVQLARHELATGHFTDAEVLLNQALGKSVQDKDRLWEAVSLMYLGHVGSRSGQFARARDNLERSLALARELGNDEIRAVSLSSLGEVCVELRLLDDAAGYLHECLKLQERASDSMGRLKTLSQLITTYRAMGKHDDVKVYVGASMALAKELAERGKLKNAPELARHAPVVD